MRFEASPTSVPPANTFSAARTPPWRLHLLAVHLVTNMAWLPLVLVVSVIHVLDHDQIARYMPSIHLSPSRCALRPLPHLCIPRQTRRRRRHLCRSSVRSVFTFTIPTVVQELLCQYRGEGEYFPPVLVAAAGRLDVIEHLQRIYGAHAHERGEEPEPTISRVPFLLESERSLENFIAQIYWCELLSTLRRII